MPGIYPLKGVIKQYDWGGHRFIPELLQLHHTGNKPFAEFWMGVHPGGESQVLNDAGDWEALSHYSGRLPFLFKVLDVREMLSIQVHPSKEAAEREFARENAEGIPLEAPHRNYKDDNHKPELMVALGDFWLLHGFKTQEELVYTLLNVAELRELLPIFNKGGYAGLYRHIMEMPQAGVDRILRPLVENISNVYQNGEPDRWDEDYWAARAAQTFSRDGHIDRGIFSIYFFNLVHLKKGEGVFQAAGVPHAYLEGRNAEIMASSDNVLRGGLTSKHIDVPELMKHIRFEATAPEVLTGDPGNSGEIIYKAPVADFALGVYRLKRGESVTIHTHSPEIWLITEGEAMVMESGKKLPLQYGSPVIFVSPGLNPSLSAITEATIFRASVPA